MASMHDLKVDAPPPNPSPPLAKTPLITRCDAARAERHPPAAAAPALAQDAERWEAVQTHVATAGMSGVVVGCVAASVLFCESN